MDRLLPNGGLLPNMPVTARLLGVPVLVLATLLSTPLHANEEQLVHMIRFSDYESGPIEAWLSTKGFQFERDVKRRNRVDLYVDSDRLVIETHRKAFGMMQNESVDLPEFTYVEIDWGVKKHPEGASYEQGLRNEAIMVIVFMGDERRPSGSMLIPNSPYFIGLFLCSGDDRRGHPYLGSYFKKSGRYVCLDSPEPGEIVTSRFNLLDGYRTYFDKERDDNPGISGLAVSVDTQKGKDGRALALIQEIRFYR